MWVKKNNFKFLIHNFSLLKILCKLTQRRTKKCAALYFKQVKKKNLIANINSILTDTVTVLQQMMYAIRGNLDVLHKSRNYHRTEYILFL